jgi:hypothetical protein
VGHALAPDFMPPDCPLEFLREEDADTICASPERRVDDEDGFLRSDVGYADCDAIEFLANPLVTALRAGSDLRQGLLSPYILAPQCFMFSIFFSGRLKLVSAIQALVSPESAANSVFLGVPIAAFRARAGVFLEDIVNIQRVSL